MNIIHEYMGADPEDYCQCDRPDIDWHSYHKRFWCKMCCGPTAPDYKEDRNAQHLVECKLAGDELLGRALDILEPPEDYKPYSLAAIRATQRHLWIIAPTDERFTAMEQTLKESEKEWKIRNKYKESSKKQENEHGRNGTYPNL